MTEAKLNCHICGSITDFYCEDCGEPVCDKCAIAYTPKNNCEGTHCSDCYETSQWVVAREYQRKEERERKKEDERKKKNAMARRRYHSPEQREKRRLAKMGLAKRRWEIRLKQIKEAREVLKGFRF
jgi:hypothetical protein